MGGPWEKYQSVQDDSGPWTKYQVGDQPSLGQNALSDLKGQAMGLASNAIDMAKSGGQSYWEKPMQIAAQTGADLISGKPLSETPYAGLVQGAKETGSRIYNEFRHPIDSFQQHPVNTALDVGGTALGVGEEIAGKVAPAVAEKFGSLATNPEATKIAMKNPSALKSIPSTEDLANRLPDVVQKISDQIGEHMDIAKDSLSTSKYLEEGAITKDEISNLLDKARGQLGGIYSSEGQKAANTIGNMGEDFKKIHETISQKQVYDMMQKLDDEIPWEKIHSRPDDVSPEEWSMVEVRRGMRNLLGEKNPDFSAMMEPVSLLEKDRGALMRNFGLKRDVEGIRPGDQTVSKLANSLRENQKIAKPESQRVLENVKASAGEDLITPLKLQAFAGPTAESPMGIPSRMGGAAAGAAMGQGFGLSGIGLGGMVGSRVLRPSMSTLGRNMASGMIQAAPGIAERETSGLSTVLVNNLIRQDPSKLGKYSSILQQAAQAGQSSLGATHFVLQQRDPEYQELMKNLTQNGGGEQ